LLSLWLLENSFKVQRVTFHGFIMWTPAPTRLLPVHQSVANSFWINFNSVEQTQKIVRFFFESSILLLLLDYRLTERARALALQQDQTNSKQNIWSVHVPMPTFWSSCSPARSNQQQTEHLICACTHAHILKLWKHTLWTRYYLLGSLHEDLLDGGFR
jgi:hypothetical protein